MYRILIVEDHETLGYVLVEYLKMHHFEVYLSTSAEDGLIKFKRMSPHLCLLDVSLPGMNGFELAEKIKDAREDMPIIFLTARGLKVDRIKGLRLQADDYLVKPVDEEELVLRVQSVLRRVYSKQARDTEIYTIGKINFEPANQLLKWDKEQQVMTEKESAILELLCKHKENLVNRKLILKEIWGITDLFAARTMDVHLSKIRKYLSVDPTINIVNIHGQGFILTDKNH
ncbi:MAG TPA: response regulator transcription factor [Chitinophagaceae bacterium]|nr:response regulator transcription factor [Chitinophagaceae bacterium]